MRLVLHLRFGERRAAVCAPVHGLLALVDHALLHELAEGADDGGLVAEVHGAVGRAPQADDAKALEAVPLDVEVLLGVRAAGPAKVGRAHLPLPGAELAVDLQLDGQAVAIPARQVRCVVASHVVRLDDQVLQDLVERRADVDLAVGVWRAVVQQEDRGALARGANLPVQVHLVPAGDGLGLGRLQVGLHREGGPGQVAGLFPVGHRCSSIVL